MKFESSLRFLFIGLLVLSVVNCATTREILDLDTAIHLSVTTSPDLNPDQDGRASPLVIKVFALSDDRQFKREDFLSLYENPADRLGADLIQTFELKEFSPDEIREEIVRLTPQTRFIGVMAAYVQYDVAQALLIFPVTPHKTTKFNVRADRLRIVASNK